jgi:hypothetical protein
MAQKAIAVIKAPEANREPTGRWVHKGREAAPVHRATKDRKVTKAIREHMAAQAYRGQLEHKATRAFEARREHKERRDEY